MRTEKELDLEALDEFEASPIWHAILNRLEETRQQQINRLIAAAPGDIHRLQGVVQGIDIAKNQLKVLREEAR